MRLEGKTAVIIGGSGGIGLALAQAMDREGARLAIVGRSRDKLDQAGSVLARHTILHPADVNDPEALDDMVASLTGQLGAPDILVNCQGTTVIKPTLEITREEFAAVMRTNIESVTFASLGFGRAMIARGSGSIINIASLSAHRGWPLAAVYAMSKHAIIGLTKSLAAEWAPHGVRCNSISPGFFMTELNRERMAQARKDAALARTPFARFGAVEELAGAALYLASDEAGFVSGTDINVDGGYLASGI
ncbi:SDR family NAD(P)-dependent oxidoreductase [Pelagibacterium montanilacus]|uniref:SDR family NAD(P)-dependent oxidoreductase n=1 Tax=Pelagibacterium montanilacus TaxID=2185280 RepID=UPI000F8DA8C3|nr:SDR family oxidoreductase [Pelagibacterium montanilacus]